MKSRRRLWSERHARRDQILAVAIALFVVAAMAVTFIVVSHTWTAGSVSATGY